MPPQDNYIPTPARKILQIPAKSRIVENRICRIANWEQFLVDKVDKFVHKPILKP
jgi:hypothetical protein